MFPIHNINIKSLTEDILQFLSILNIDRVIIVEYFMANIEMTRISIKRPDLLIKMIFLDPNPTLDRTIRDEMMKSYPFNYSEEDEADLQTITSIDEYIPRFLESNSYFKNLWNDVFDYHLRENLTINKDGYVAEPGSEKSGEIIKSMLIKNPGASSDVSVFGEETRIAKRRASLKHLHCSALQASGFMAKPRRVQSLHPRSKLRSILARRINGEIVELENTSHYCFIDNEKKVFQKMKQFIMEI